MEKKWVKQTPIIKNIPPTIRWVPTRARLSLIQLFRFYVFSFFGQNKNRILFSWTRSLSVRGDGILYNIIALMYCWKQHQNVYLKSKLRTRVSVYSVVLSNCCRREREREREWDKHPYKRNWRRHCICVCMSMLSACICATKPTRAIANASKYVLT